MRVFADLDNTEESVAFHTELPVDVAVDLEGHCAALLLELTELVLSIWVDLHLV